MESLLPINGQEPDQLRKLLQDLLVKRNPTDGLGNRSSMQKDRAGADHFLMHFNVGGTQSCVPPLALHADSSSGRRPS